MLVLDEIIVAYYFWLKAIRIMDLQNNLTTGNLIPRTILGCEIKCLPQKERKSYAMLDESVELEAEGSFEIDDVNEQVRVNIQEQISIWYDYCWGELPRRLVILTVENTVQFSYQTSMLIYEYVYPNLWDIDDNIYKYHLVSVLRILSISSSLWSIVSPIINRQTILALIRGGESSGLSTVIKCLQIVIHMAISTVIVLLLGFITNFFY